MNKFVVLHFNALNATNNEVVLSIRNINAIYPSKTGGSMVFMMADTDPVVVYETPREIMDLILNNR